MCFGVHSALAGGIESHLSLCFPLVQSQGHPGVRLGPSQVFPGTVHSPMYMWGLLDSQGYIQVFHSLLFPSFFLVLWSSFMVILLLAPPGSAHWATATLKKWPVIVFNKCPEVMVCH